MKRLVLMLALVSVATNVRAQYISRPPAEVVDYPSEYHGIRVNTEAVRTNEDAWNSYVDFDKEYRKLDARRKKWGAGMLVSLIGMGGSLIPMAYYAMKDNRNRYTTQVEVSCAVLCTGVIGLLVTTAGGWIANEQLSDTNLAFTAYMNHNHGGLGIIKEF